MCVILFSWAPGTNRALVVAANRDELHARPTLPLAWWEGEEIAGGRDLRAGGGWMAVSRSGRFAAVTNFRSGVGPRVFPRSRGDLVAGFLRSDAGPLAWCEQILREGNAYDGFNLLAGDLRSMVWCSNRASDAVVTLGPGVYGVSNGLLDEPWPKVIAGKAALEAGLGWNDDELTAHLFAVLADRTAADDDQLPETGVGRDRERLLSPLFIVHEEYGTRSSTVLVARPSAVTVEERRFTSDGSPAGRSRMIVDRPFRTEKGHKSVR